MNLNSSYVTSDKAPFFWGITFVVLVLLYSPSFYGLANTLWATDEQGHGPLILLISAFLLWQKRNVLLSHEYQPTKFVEILGSLILVFGGLTFLLGKYLGMLAFEIGSLIIILSAIVLIYKGSRAFKKLLFPILFLIFMIPLPGIVVDTLTLPMKILVSNVAEFTLYELGYPIARDGVILQIGYYKLLVADACAGLHTVFTLEAMGLLYLHLIKRDSFFRNVTLAIMIIPISLIANSTRVIILVLITYYFGDEVGQGFIHGFAGFVLFGVALVLIILFDTLIHTYEKKFISSKKVSKNDI